MYGLTKVGLASLIVFTALWSTTLIHSYISSEMTMGHCGALVIAIAVGVYISLQSRRLITAKPKQQKFQETHVIFSLHLPILVLLGFCVAAMTIGVSNHLFKTTLSIDKMALELIVYSGFVYLLLYGTVIVTLGKMLIYSEGLWITLRYISWEDLEKAELKWNGKLLTFGKLDTFILPKPHKFIKALKEFRPNLAERIKDQIER